MMKLRTASPRWFNDEDSDKEAKCVAFPGTSSYDPWFGSADATQIEDFEEMEEAKTICLGTHDGRECPLRQQCLEFALVNNERFGVWGGTLPEERKQIRKQRRAEAKCQSPEAGDPSSQAA